MKQFYFLNANDGLITRNLHIFSPPPLYATSAVYRHFMQLDAHFRRFEQQSAKRRMSGSHWDLDLAQTNILYFRDNLHNT